MFSLPNSRDSRTEVTAVSDAFDTTIPGIPADLHEASSWFEDCFNSLEEVQDCLVHAANIREVAWQGATSDAYYEVCGGLSTLILEIQARLREGADILQTYGDQLHRAQRDMTEILDEAEAGGLVTDGPLIQHPFLTVDPAQYADPSFAGEVELAERRARLYEHLESEAENAANELETWVAEYLIPFENKIRAIDLNGLLSDLAQNLGISGLEAAGTVLIQNAENLADQGGRLAAMGKAAAVNSPLIDIGLPSRKAQALARQAESHITASKIPSVLGKGLEGLGSLANVITTANEIWTSESSSSEIAGAGLGALTTTAVSSLTSAGPIGAAVAGAIAAGGGKYIYRRTVSLESQEQLDDLVDYRVDKINDVVDRIIHDY